MGRDGWQDTHDGLSPRVRGNRGFRIDGGMLSGSIPARAGEPERVECQRLRHKVYPRACGGTERTAWPQRSWERLSPRVRGNSNGPLGRNEDGRVYPRACGGTADEGLTGATGAGLSPRVRGNRRAGPRQLEGVGSIPARAGEPQQIMSGSFLPPVYPRACGGTWRVWSGQNQCRGLSPRVRGNRSWTLASAVGLGSIPARAGEPRRPGCGPHSQRVYPRACGGTMMFPGMGYLSHGLSPRVRGNPPPTNPTACWTGVYPRACGGTFRVGVARRQEGVYPRACGGTFRVALHLWPHQGLSPRVRGNPGPRLREPDHQGSIPARAGEPYENTLDFLHLMVYPRACGGTTMKPAELCPNCGLSPRVRGNRARPL